MGKVWKNGGEEDIYIRRLIRGGKINKNTKPSELKKLNAGMFSDFTMNMVRNHLNALKMSCGLFADEGRYFDFEVVEDNPEPKDAATEQRSQNKSLEEPIAGFQDIHFRNFPILCETFKDPSNSSDKVALAVSLPAGAQNVTIEVGENGLSAAVKYNWPKTMYDMDELFSKMLMRGEINEHHPRVLCIKNGLEKCRKRDEDIPEASLTVTLPMKVLTGGEFWSMSGVKRPDGTQILMAEFTGFVKDYNCKVRGVKFE